MQVARNRLLTNSAAHTRASAALDAKRAYAHKLDTRLEALHAQTDVLQQAMQGGVYADLNADGRTHGQKQTLKSSIIETMFT